MPKPLLHRRLHPKVALGLTLGLGVGLSVLATSLVNRWEVSNQRGRFQRQIENLRTALQRSLNRYTDVLAFLGDYYDVQQGLIDRDAFARFVGRSLQTHPGIQALEWAPLLPQAERLGYEQRIQQTDYGDFQITELDGDGQLQRAMERPFYVPVTYVEPFRDNESALGYDLNSNEIRAIAIAQARESGKITATGRIRLVQEKRDQFGFLVFLPLYEFPPQGGQNFPDPTQFKGVLLGVFRVSNVVEEALQDLQYEIDFTLRDRSASTEEQFLGRYDAQRKQVSTLEPGDAPNAAEQLLCPTAALCTQTVTVGQRNWLVTFSPAVNYPVENQYGAIATLGVGLFLTSGLVFFLHRLNHELEQTKSLSELRFRFFSMASHELRTPLSTILLSSENLQFHQGQLTESQKQTNIQRIYLTAKRMGQQIADLLMLTRAEVKQLEFQPGLLAVDAFCEQLVDEMQMGMRQPLQFLRPGQPAKAFLDKKLLQSLLTNLLSNAAKYSPPDAPIHLTLRVTAQEIIFEIRDRGIGIPIADQPHVCQPFYRGNNVGTVTGTGLGLAVVKTCVDLHRGEWAIASAPDAGTTVTVKLPLE